MNGENGTGFNAAGPGGAEGRAREHAENAEQDGDGGKATANGTVRRWPLTLDFGLPSQDFGLWTLDFGP